MIISHEHKFIFLKTRKTAGTSIELALSQLCGPDDIITPIVRRDDEPCRAQTGAAAELAACMAGGRSSRPLFERYWFRANPGDYGFYNHIPAKRSPQALLNDEEVWRSYFKFAFERNPWDRQVSAYHFRYRRTENPPPFSSYLHRKAARLDQQLRDLFHRRRSLRRFRRRATKALDRGFPQGAETDWPAISIKTCRAPRPTSGSSEKPYRDYYDDETRGIVSDWYAPEIRLLAYEF